MDDTNRDGMRGIGPQAGSVDSDQDLRTSLPVVLRPVKSSDAGQYHLQTVRRVAYSLLALLALTILVHYAVTVYVVIWGEKDNMDRIDQVFNVILPVVSGLAGSAATYFFTEPRR